MRAAMSSVVFTAGLLLTIAPGRASAGDSAESSELLTPLGEYLLLGGGVTDFTKDATWNRFDTGGAWDVERWAVGASLGYEF